MQKTPNITNTEVNVNMHRPFSVSSNNIYFGCLKIKKKCSQNKKSIKNAFGEKMQTRFYIYDLSRQMLVIITLPREIVF